MKICGTLKMECCNEADINFYRSGAFKACECLPACLAISYAHNVETSQAVYDLVTFIDKSKIFVPPKFSFEGLETLTLTDNYSIFVIYIMILS